MIELTEEQRQQLENGQAVDVLYDDSDWTDDELRLRLARSTKANGWDEAAMDAYDRYDDELRNPALGVP